MKDTLRNIVLTVIGYLINDQASFTAHDVTAKVRDGIKDGLYDIDGQPWEDIDGVHTQRVEHEDVRAIVRAEARTAILNAGYKVFDAGYKGVYDGAHTTYHSAIGVLPPITAIVGDNDGPSAPVASTQAPFDSPVGTTYNVSKVQPTGRKVQHRFQVRPNMSVTVTLPEDLTQKEAQRLSDFLRTLPFEQVNHHDICDIY